MSIILYREIDNRNNTLWLGLCSWSFNEVMILQALNDHERALNEHNDLHNGLLLLYYIY